MTDLEAAQAAIVEALCTGTIENYRWRTVRRPTLGAFAIAVENRMIVLRGRGGRRSFIDPLAQRAIQIKECAKSL